MSYSGRLLYSLSRIADVSVIDRRGTAVCDRYNLELLRRMREGVKMKNLCIIPARGGSKRIPRKNVKDFLGKPIIAYSIEAALKSGLFDEVMVSTDDPEIATIAKQYGASVPFMRSAETVNDFATTADVLNEVLSEYKKRGQVFDNMCCIYATAPLIVSQDIVDAQIVACEDEPFDSNISETQRIV